MILFPNSCALRKCFRSHAHMKTEPSEFIPGNGVVTHSTTVLTIKWTDSSHKKGCPFYVNNIEAYKRKIHKWFIHNVVSRAKFGVSTQRFSAELLCPYISLVTVNSLLLKLHHYCAATSRHIKSKKLEKIGIEPFFCNQ